MTIATEIKNNRLYVTSPFNREFINEAKNLHGKFDGTTKQWHFDLRDQNIMSQLLKRIYGTDGTDTSTVDVKVTVDYDIRCDLGPIIMAGREIAAARGRDSGAKPGQNIIFTTKKPQSGGSVKNWETIIKKGAVFEIRDLAETALSMLDDDELLYTDKISYVIINQNIASQTQLIAEREKLQLRIDEINKLLRNDEPAIELSDDELYAAMNNSEYDGGCY